MGMEEVEAAERLAGLLPPPHSEDATSCKRFIVVQKMFYFPSSIAGGEKRAGAVCRAGNSRKRVLDRRASSLGFSGALKPPREGRGRGAMGKINCLSEREELVSPFFLSLLLQCCKEKLKFFRILLLYSLSLLLSWGGRKWENGVLVPLLLR